MFAHDRCDDHGRAVAPRDLAVSSGVAITAVDWRPNLPVLGDWRAPMRVPVGTGSYYVQPTTYE
jgi:hypothetical protein